MSDYKTKLGSLPQGEFYECFDPDDLSHESPEEAVFASVEFWYADDAKTVREQVKRACPLTVTSYKRNEVEDSWFAGMTDHVVAVASEGFAEEYGGGDDFDCTDKVKKHRDVIEMALRTAFARVLPWQCHPVGKVTLDEADVLALIADERPEWIEVAGDE